MMHAHFPDARDFEGILSGATRSGLLDLKMTEKGIMVVARRGNPLSDHNGNPKPELPSAEKPTDTPNA